MKKFFQFLFAIFLLLSTDSMVAQQYFLHVKSEISSEQSTITPFQTIDIFPSIEDANKSYISIQNQLIKKGYLHLKSQKLEQKNDTLLVGTIHLGQCFEKTKIYIDKVDPSIKKIANWKADTLIIATNDFEGFLTNTLQQFDKEGYPMTEISIENQTINFPYVEVQLNVKQDVQRKINQLYTTPYTEFPKNVKKFVERRHKNKLVSSLSIHQVEQDIFQLSYVKKNRESEVLFTENTTVLYLYSEKKNANQFDGLIGFANSEESKKLVFNGYINIQLANTLNAGETLKLHWKNDGNQQSSLQVETIFPNIASTALGVSSQIHIFKQDSLMQNTQLGLEVLYSLSTKNYVGLGIQSQKSTTSTTNSWVTEDYSNLFYTLSHFSSQNSDLELFPVQFSSSFKLGYGKRTNEISPTVSQWFVKWKIEKLWQLHPKHFIHQSVETFILQTKQPLYNEMYRFGGQNSLRGFAQNSMYAQKIVGSYQEIRQLLSSTMYSFLILDGAVFNYDDTWKGAFSTGLGIGLETNGGIFDLSYAIGKRPEEKFSFQNAIFHIGYKARF
ncbi:hypothetical protein AB4865_10015 [Capnocytophaga sp. ARDL2]|uniref:hypothetical protein n=1 Tax=Capnocytophaga sp. ARDL2 TaxID=3238809 RepID=UPI0035584759